MEIIVTPDRYSMDMETRKHLAALIDSLAEQQDAGIKFMSQHLQPDETYQCWCCNGRAAKLADVVHETGCPITQMRELARRINL